MLSFILAALAVLMVVCIVDAIVIVPAYHFAVHNRLGRRTGVIFYEGFNLKLPFIDTAELISMALEEIEVEAFFTTGKVTKPGAQTSPNTAQNSQEQEEKDDKLKDDKLQMVLTGSIQYCPSPYVTNEEGRNVFISVSETIIQSGVADMLKDLLGGLGGIYQAEDFIENRQAFGDLVNQILRFAIPFHLRHCRDKDEKPVECTAEDADGNRCRHQGVKNIPREDLIDFYNFHWEVIREERSRRAEDEMARRNSAVKETPEEEARRHLENMSPIEKRYGIDIKIFALEKIDFSDDMKKAFEKRREAAERRKAFNIKLDMATRAKAALNVDGQVALNAADVSLTPEIARNKTVVSVEGEAGVLGGLFGKLTGTSNSGAGNSNASRRR